MQRVCSRLTLMMKSQQRGEKLYAQKYISQVKIIRAGACICVVGPMCHKYTYYNTEPGDDECASRKKEASARERERGKEGIKIIIKRILIAKVADRRFVCAFFFFSSQLNVVRPAAAVYFSVSRGKMCWLAASAVCNRGK